MRSPYSSLAPRAFWRNGVAGKNPSSVVDLYQPKFPISQDLKIATAGSCFAQHIARHLRLRDYNVLDLEPPSAAIPDSVAKRFGYRMFSARFGNIYAVQQLLQIAEETIGNTPLPESLVVWEAEGRYFDAMRPSVEPEGLDSAAEVMAHRQQHLHYVDRLFRLADIFVFTLGLTETWRDRESGTAWPTAPGTIAGSYDPDRHEFHNAGFAEILGQFEAFRTLIRRVNPEIKFLLTVSPVPLTATASDNHVLVATTYSKSVLRAVAGELAATHDDIDYFPSYELVASPLARAELYEPNLRTVRMDGVDMVMRQFFAAHGVETLDTDAAGPADSDADTAAYPEIDADEEALCDDVLLEQFAPGS
ncbi:GSCFA domain-containing protein [Parasphingopyxis sp. CP4]|uniref:GSCFA domain-containing protein n=1 Tax=Parasphingopyxis sp. CP4 TaxID=2724527 RepID=UPI0015A44337|nr:GSCFA domain-containing protein [Parasphingopyxis sp. CP4]QLC22731.1 GSCFA domain-containing protein [Parasphingopyxis sp. CP4]